MDRNGEPLPIHNLGFSLLYAGFTVIHLFVYCYVGDRLLVEVSGEDPTFNFLSIFFQFRVTQNII